MTAAEANLRNRHFHQIAAVAHPASRMKPSAARSLGRVQNVLNLVHRLGCQMVHLEIDGAIRAVELAIKLPIDRPLQ